MSEEEIRKALEIIKQPITVNCIEYKYFDRENYDKLISVYDNCLWIVNLFEQAKEHIEPIQQENKQLKEVIEEVRELINTPLFSVDLDLMDNDELLYVRAIFFKELLQILDKAKENKND